MKKRPVKKYVVDVGPRDNSAERDDEQSCDGIFHNLFALYWCSTKRQIRWRQLLFLDRFRRTIRTITLVKFGSEMGVVLNLFAQLAKLKIRHRHFRTHQNDQLTAHIRGRSIPEKRPDVRESIENRNSFDVFLLTVSDQTTQNDCSSIGSGNICSYITRGDVRNCVSVYDC